MLEDLEFLAGYLFILLPLGLYLLTAPVQWIGEWLKKRTGYSSPGTALLIWILVLVMVYSGLMFIHDSLGALRGGWPVWK